LRLTPLEQVGDVEHLPQEVEELLWKKGADDVERGEHRGKALRRP